MDVLRVTINCWRKDVLGSVVPVLVLFYSKWNRESSGALEAFRELAEKTGEDLIIACTNGDEEAELDAWYRIIDFPTAVLIRNGKEAGRIAGSRTAELYRAWAKSFLEKTPSSPRDVMSDTWTAIDRLGRTLPVFGEAPPPNKDKKIAMFYFISFSRLEDDPAKRIGPFDITKILNECPSAIDEADNPLWGPYGSVHFWGESVYGYYRSLDEYVIAKHAQMLSDAGVDVIVFDVSNFNRFTDPPSAYFPETFQAVFKTFDRVRRQGRGTPQIAFLFNFWYGPYAVRQIYKDVYEKGLWRDIWFMWEGKPLVLFDKEKIPEDEKSLRDFFTFRRPMPDYFYGPQGPDQWAWCEIYPQHAFWSKANPGKAEEVAVSVAQNAVPDDSAPGGWTLGCMSQKDADGKFVARGRSFHGGVQPAAYAPQWGANFDEQWNRAFELDADLVFITGWNEWVMGRGPEFIHYKAANVMVDQFSEEFSRDLEPSKTVIGDNAYYQFTAWARRFKGVRPIPASRQRMTIDISGPFSQWNNAGPEYLDDIGDIEERSCEGYGAAGLYENRTGRNDLVLMKAARDDRFVYFYASTASPLTPCVDKLWMNLLLRTDLSGAAPSWEGFQYLVRPDGENRITLYRAGGGGGFEWQAVAAVENRAAGNEFMLKIPLAFLGLKGENPVTLDFKWCDNVALGKDTQYCLDFYTSGDTAPNGRFCYRYREK